MSKEFKHTPGPWVKNKYGDVRGSNGKKVVTRGLSIPALLAGGENLEEEEANARIMLCAPDLLMIVKRLVALNVGTPALLADAHAALAKARGE